MLYRYLKELDGICASHTSATGMGTDWRDNDPMVEPIVEIYQGDRMSYEIRGRPAGRLRPEGRQEAGPTSAAGSRRASSTTPWRRATASASSRRATTGPRTSPTASSWPRSTTAQGILDGAEEAPLSTAPPTTSSSTSAAATHIMGDEFKTNAPPTLEIHVDRHRHRSRGSTSCKDSEVVETIKPRPGGVQGDVDRPEADGGRALLLRPRAAGGRPAGVGVADVDRLRAVSPASW